MLNFTQNDITYIMSKQPLFEIGLIGHVSTGKSSTIKHLTGIVTDTHSKGKGEGRNFSVKTGYANMKIWKNLLNELSTINNGNNCELVHNISLIDCPGHQDLIINMMSSVSSMKGVIVVVSSAEPIEEQIQLKQHLITIKIAGIKKIIIIFNKLDLVTKEKANLRKEELDEYLQKLGIVPNYIIPTVINKKLGLPNLIKAIMELFPPQLYFNESSNVLFKVTRSFDVNKPGTDWDKINGGVFGGTLNCGKMSVGDEIEIRPGQWTSDSDGNFVVNPIKTKIITLQSNKEQLSEIYPGCLSAIGSDIDPFFCKDDRLVGSLVGFVGKLPNVYQYINLKFTLTPENDNKWTPKINDKISLQIGNSNTEANIEEIKDDIYTLKLFKPVCINDNDLILICNKFNQILKIVGYGNFLYGKKLL